MKLTKPQLKTLDVILRKVLHAEVPLTVREHDLAEKLLLPLPEADD